MLSSVVFWRARANFQLYSSKTICLQTKAKKTKVDELLNHFQNEPLACNAHKKQHLNSRLKYDFIFAAQPNVKWIDRFEKLICSVHGS